MSLANRSNERGMERIQGNKFRCFEQKKTSTLFLLLALLTFHRQQHFQFLSVRFLPEHWIDWIQTFWPPNYLHESAYLLYKQESVTTFHITMEIHTHGHFVYFLRYISLHQFGKLKQSNGSKCIMNERASVFVKTFCS